MSQAVVEPHPGKSAIEEELLRETGFAGRKRTLLIWGGGAVLALLLIFGVRYLVWSAHHESTDDAYLAGHVHPISARITDTVQHVMIDDNQHVVEGQTLVILDPNDYRVRLDHATAALNAAKRQADTAEAAIRSISQSATAQTTEAQGSIGDAKATIEASKAAVAAAEAGVPRAESQLNEANATLRGPVCEGAGFEANAGSPKGQLSSGTRCESRIAGASTPGAGTVDRRTARRGPSRIPAYAF